MVLQRDIDEALLAYGVEDDQIEELALEIAKKRIAKESA